MSLPLSVSCQVVDGYHLCVFWGVDQCGQSGIAGDRARQSHLQLTAVYGVGRYAGALIAGKLWQVVATQVW